MNGQLEPYVSALIYYVLSKIDEPDHLLAVVCKQTKGIFCCSCLAWNCDSEAFRRHKRYCDGFSAWDEDSIRAFKLMYSDFAGKSQTDRSKRLETVGLPIPSFLISSQVKANRAAPGPNGEKAEYPHLHPDAAVCLLCATCSVCHGKADIVQKCCNGFFIGRGLTAVVHSTSRHKTLLLLDVLLDSAVRVGNPKHPNVRVVDATMAWNELVAGAVPRTLHSSFYVPRVAGAAASTAAPGSGTTTTTTTTPINRLFPNPSEVEMLEANREKRLKTLGRGFSSPLGRNTVNDAETVPFVRRVKISELISYRSQLSALPSAYKPAHSVEDLLWSKLKLGPLGLSGAVHLALIGEACRTPTDAISRFICQGVEDFVKTGQAMLAVTSPTVLRFIYNLALDDLNVGVDGLAATNHRSFNGVTESTAHTRVHLLSRVAMVDYASGGCSMKPFEDAFARAQRELQIHGQRIGKHVNNIDAEEASRVTLPFALAAVVDIFLAAVLITKETCGMCSSAPFTRAFLSQILTLHDRELALKAQQDAENGEEETGGTWVEYDTLKSAGVGLAGYSVIASASNAMIFGFRLAVLHALHYNALAENDLSLLQGSLILQYHANCLAQVKHLGTPSLDNNIVTQCKDGALQFVTSKGDSFGAEEIAMALISLTEEVIGIVSEFVAGSSFQTEDKGTILHELFSLIRRGKLSNKFQVATGASGIGPAAGAAGRGFTVLALIVRHFVEIDDVVDAEVEMDRRSRFFELWGKCRVAVMAIIQLTCLFDYRECGLYLCAAIFD